MVAYCPIALLLYKRATQQKLNSSNAARFIIKIRLTL